mmetsp:Transcript_15394/g.14759  ORF Transcript_15394/g.14759 Transcript_15394/m.14759 type:complete len:162 (-) Transcript_15394:231-716(-)
MFSQSLLVVVMMVISTNAFMVPSFRSIYKMKSLKMSDEGGPDPMQAIRDRMAQDPSFDPLQDPQTMQELENMIPGEYREFANAMERLKVAFDDATAGVDGLENLDDLASVAADTKIAELLSSPQSKYFQDGAQDEQIPFDGEATKDLLADVQRDFPEVPME